MSPTPPAAAATTPVSVTVTSSDRALLLEPDEVSFEAGVSALPTIVVDPHTTFQTFRGVGASITHSSAALINALPDAQRREVMEMLFDPEEGIGLSVLRQPIGSSDFTPTSEHFTLADSADEDPGITSFDLSPDEETVLPLLREAREINPELTIIATPWSPPAWMKTSGSLDGGRLRSDSGVPKAYARYLAMAAEAYAQAGVPIDYLTVQNEPQHDAAVGYTTSGLDPLAAAEVIRHLGPQLYLRDLDTAVLGFDHNWALHPNDTTSTDGAANDPDYARTLMAQEGLWAMDGIAFHCYYGDPSAMTDFHADHPGEDLWVTECSGSHAPGDSDAKAFHDTFTWQTRMLTVGSMRNWASGVVGWNIALDADHGPYLGGCGTCTGFLTIEGMTVTPNAEYYAFAHLSAFVDVGAVRIDSTSWGATSWDGRPMSVAFRNPDGTYALLVHNQHDDPRSVAVAFGEQVLEYELPGGGVATFTWDAAGMPQPTAPVDLAGAEVTTEPTSGSQAASSGASGMRTVTLALGRVRSVSAVSLDIGDARGSEADRWVVETSWDGQKWTEVARGEGPALRAYSAFDRTWVKYVRVSVPADSGNAWDAAEFRVFR
ncbi:glycoside hydrolase family 30 protein [Serinibacter salmoneus]|uniref:Glucosylceramidase n=1 Tax=Serinibacter salmoneus TaxID=556530 RepID=A0A2A9D479_9MICO|nr:glycoside hydrolase family 30 beta sandwich domain-containing protein [Serinibacter salmoneus]PFG20660.1 glucosylceramidase [Serinibacter salmoneus]